ncbi:benzoate-CoA ligase family protein [Thermoactinomyces mirandus]|uniref:Benzoate-CoA ligase family protein n=1 Tax=Thermoactinomyces mirandus TaxID=2756294 RepID=A0A7W1XV93_9BACL|nr:benzoate-CoA ligase family protein [Thermoactinomyces mirandus]MBA4603826.1 benzoate-CoA ligase family protein [Thermoactinomyces mirandus]
MDLRGIGTPYNASSRFIDDNVKNGMGDRVAIYYQDQQITYRQLQERVNRVGNMLTELDLKMENRVLLVCHDTPEFVYSFFGAIKLGAVPIPVNTMMKPSDYEYYLNNSRARVLIIHQGLWENIIHLKDRFIYLEYVIVIPESDQGNFAGVLNFCDMMENAGNMLDSCYTQSDDSAFWLFSSGSTGEPKGVIHLQHDMEYALDHYAKNILKISKNDICFSASKLFFAYGLGGGMYFPFGVGAATVLLPDRPFPEVVLQVIEKCRPTIFFGVPTLYGNLIDFTEKNGKLYDLSSLRICVSAGEALPAAFLRKWKKIYNLDILDGIGSTEALHIYLSNRIDDIRGGSSGKVVPGYEARIVNEEGEDLPPNEVGDLLIRGDSIAQGYWNLHEQTKQKFLGEWLNTGDKYYMDEDGYYWYCGRSDDMIKTGGIWVSPIEIENCLLRHETVLEAAVVGVTDENELSLPKAYIVLKEGVQPTEDLACELKTFVKENLARYKYPRIIKFTDNLPKTTTGKIQRFKLKLDNDNQGNKL